MSELLRTEELPTGWSVREPDERDIAPLALLRAAVTRAATGLASPDVSSVMSEIVESGSWTRRQLVVLDDQDVTRGWCAVHDRAAGRTVVHVTIDPDLDLDHADLLARVMFAWCASTAEGVTRLRGLDATQLDTGAYAGDGRQRRWLEAAGFRCTRRWLQMSRPVTGEDSGFPEPREGVVVRRVRRRPNGLPFASDVQAVHWVLETSFEDHFNAYRESFPEFVHRLQEAPGHAWDHWWLAMLRHEDGTETPGGAIVSTMLSRDGADAFGSYVEYIGVHRDARGRGVAKSLLTTVIADAASRGRNRVGLEVDASSPTGADGLYRAMGWETAYVTESWHRDIAF